MSVNLCLMQVYITCSVILCETGNPLSRCAQGCVDKPPQRRKRALYKETASHDITTGPLTLLREGDGDIRPCTRPYVYTVCHMSKPHSTLQPFLIEMDKPTHPLNPGLVFFFMSYKLLVIYQSDHCFLFLPSREFLGPSGIRWSWEIEGTAWLQ